MSETLPVGAYEGNGHCVCCEKWAAKKRPKAPRMGIRRVHSIIKFDLVWDDKRGCSCSGDCMCKADPAPGGGA